MLFVLGNAAVAAAMALVGTLRSTPLARFWTRVREFLARFGVAKLGLTALGATASAFQNWVIKTEGVVVPWWAMHTANEFVVAVVAGGLIGLGAMTAALVLPVPMEAAQQIATASTQEVREREKEEVSAEERQGEKYWV